MDNPRAVFEEIRDEPGIKKIVLMRGPRQPPDGFEGNNVEFVPMESFRGAFYVARSKYLLIGYAISRMSSYSFFLSRRHDVIQLWHGIPLKRIAHLFDGESHWDRETPYYKATVCSSPKDKEIMTQAFAPIKPENVWLTGLPRNDRILKPKDRLPRDYQHDLEKLTSRIGGKKLVLYAPTWRNSSIGIYDFTRQELDQLEGLLRKYNAVLGIRAHSNRAGNLQERKDDKQSSLLWLNDIKETNLILRVTNILISDYSSIFIDFLLLDRPIHHFVYDIEEYLDERGFLYDFDEVIGGSKALNFEQLLNQLEDSLAGRDSWREQRENSLQVFHQHPEHSSAEVVRHIKSL